MQAHETARLTTLIDELVGDRTRLRSCQVAARAAAENQYNWGHEAPRLLEAVDRALASPAPQPA